MKRFSIPLALLICSLPTLVWGQLAMTGIAPRPTVVDEFTLAGERNLLSGYPATAEDGMIHVIVEVPSGTHAKWEVDKEDGLLKWPLKEGIRRAVCYVPYPSNYGMVPRTMLPYELGGDGDPLDVMLLGPALPRGAVVKAKLIGVLEMLDRGEQDDKLLAVIPGGPMGEVNDVAELQRKYPGVIEIVRIWFNNYKGPGKIELGEVAGPEAAQEVLRISAEWYRQWAAKTEKG